MRWLAKKFDELYPSELYAILQLRNEVFVVEQSCVYQDADNRDQPSIHFMGWENETLVAYTRILPPGLVYSEPSIGRVVTSPSSRGTGLGRALMEQTLAHLYLIYGSLPVRIGAQVYLISFYNSLGFIESGERYLEDGIEHIEMVKS